jgi:integrase
MSIQHTQGTNPIHAAGRSGDDVHHSKQDAISTREFERLLEGARELARSDFYYQPDPELTIAVLGRLGLRRGELVHLREEWIDWQRKMIEIPQHDRCDFGKGGDVCGYCKQMARQRAEYADDDLDVDTALEWMWVPKTAAAVREVYFGWSPRIELYLERYFGSPEYDRYEASGAAVNRRVKKAAEIAGLDDSLSPHPLRATAATFHAARGLSPNGLTQMFGWENLATAEIYISRNSGNTARELDSIHS